MRRPLLLPLGALAAVAAPAVARAQGATVVVPIGGETTFSSSEQGGLLYVYLGVVTTWVASLVGAALLCFLVYYGFVLMFSGISEEKSKQAKEGLTATVGGIVLFLASGLILYTLNPVFFCGFGTSACTGVVLGERGTVAVPPSSAPSSPPPSAPSSAPPSAPSSAPQQPEDAAIVALCEPAGLAQRANGEDAGARADMTAARIREIVTRDYRNEIIYAMRQGGVDPLVRPELVAAIIQHESSGNPNVADGAAGEVGLMQIVPATAQAICGMSRTDLRDPGKNIACGARILSDAVQRSGSVRAGIAMYNGGYGAVGASQDCPDRYDAEGRPGGTRQAQRWECLWDDAAHTVPNTGFHVTRKYVPNVLRALGTCAA